LATFVANLSPGSSTILLEFGHTFTGLVGQIYAYDYIKELYEFKKSLTIG